ncbi:MAG: nucleotidyltransferase domain-containing protein [archaeon]|nr:nucleotidyltransferase domain-containing protein [archaeon]
MEMNNFKIERVFSNYMLDLIGPTEERETKFNSVFKMVKIIISERLNKKFPDYESKIFPYGSVPLKTYLKDSDVDITIFFSKKANEEIKTENKIIFNLPDFFANSILIELKAAFQEFNIKSKTTLFQEITLISSEIKPRI